MNAITIQNVDLPIVEMAGKRVITLAMVDAVHQRPEGTAGRNFREHRERFLEGEDFFRIGSDEFRRNNPEAIPAALRRKDVILLTESGYLMLVKSFTDDLAWEVQRKLVTCYFRAKQEARPDPAAMKAIGGMVKGIVLKAIADIRADLEDGALLGTQSAVVHGMTAGEVISAAGIAVTKGLKALPRRVSDALRRYCAEHGHLVRMARLGKTKAYVFDPAVVKLWLDSGGRQFIRRFAEDLRGQGVLTLVPPVSGGAA